MPSIVYASARTGSLILATTFSTPNVSAASCAAKALRLSPSVSAKNKSAFSVPSAAQHVLVGAVGADGLAREVRLEPAERLGVDVDDGHLVAGAGQPLGKPGADPAAADDHSAHWSSLIARASSVHHAPSYLKPKRPSVGTASAAYRAARRCSAPARAATITWHGAFWKMYGTVAPIAKSPPKRVR